MGGDEAFGDVVARLRSDNLSGASDLGRLAADALRGEALRVEAGSVDELRRSLGRMCLQVVDAQPAMAPLVTLVRAVLSAIESEDSLEGGRLAAASATEEFSRGLASRTEEVRRAAGGLLAPGCTVGTISASGAVRSLLESEGPRRGLRVICFESRPMKEGRVLAAALAGVGVDVVYAVDAAMDALAPECDVVLFGADAVGDSGVTNKIGTRALARAGSEARIPVYVLADETKLLPVGWPQPTGRQKLAHEVWDRVPSGIQVWNRYFEVIPTDLLTGVVTERGVLDLAEVEGLRHALDVPAQMWAWASR